MYTSLEVVLPCKKLMTFPRTAPSQVLKNRRCNNEIGDDLSNIMLNLKIYAILFSPTCNNCGNSDFKKCTGV